MTVLLSMCQRARLPLVDEMETKVVSFDIHLLFDERVQITVFVSMCQRARLPLVDDMETKVVSVERIESSRKRCR